ncbi:phosphodiesterase, MJ0936 family [Paenibacillus algicola]|uniref:Phosphoesterase n=1 Tax=Paenibacillus algicola TaxID=2565926 RepID=A0A4P8XLB5_9BACL|nr:metallophosphoesterase family protein [Paenibacillus algicola]QCT03085.1 phosphodiesterase, MJ0936 family [Paenibacillus algicola]
MIFRIGVVADTHMPRMAKQLPSRLTEELSACDLIIHAGDWSHPDVFQALSMLAPVEGVIGNADPEELKQQLGLTKVIEVQGVVIGIVHGHGSKGTTEQRALQAFKNMDNIQCIIYGHSHIPVLREERGILLMNPGSPTDKRRQPQYSWGILEIEEGVLSGRLVFHGDKN